ncbi:GSCOCG00011758001-RA-CDS, partial [Cotesia congregata]
EEESSVFLLPARMCTVVQINLQNTDLQTGYLPLLDTPENIFIGNCVVTNREGKCYVLAVNAYEDDIQLEIPAQELVPFECEGSSEDFFDPESDNDIGEDPRDRFQFI